VLSMLYESLPYVISSTCRALRRPLNPLASMLGRSGHSARLGSARQYDSDSVV
jgi:hypothetical protein